MKIKEFWSQFKVEIIVTLLFSWGAVLMLEASLKSFPDAISIAVTIVFLLAVGTYFLDVEEQ